MKRLQYLGVCLITIASLLTACEEEATNPSFSNDEIPRIFGWSTINKYFVDIKDSLVIDMKVSPENGATYKWFINDVEYSTKKRFSKKFDATETFDIRFEVDRNGVTNSRSGQAIVTKPFVPKPYNKKVVGFMTKNGSLETINLKNITHLVISSVVVEEVGESLVDTVFTTLNIPLIIKAAHNEGVYVLLDVTGRLDNMTGGGQYASYGFYDVIKNETKRDKAIAAIMKFAKHNAFDGVNIYLNNASEEAGKLKPEFTLPFYQAVADALPEGPNGKFFYTASAPGGWLTSELKTLAQVEEIDWVHLHPFRQGAPEITEDAPLDVFKSLAATWESFGVPREKIVNGIPAFGLHYIYPDGVDVTWGNMWMYTSYDSYKSIMARDAEAHTKTKLEVDDGIFYDGHPAVDVKTKFVLDTGLGGVMIWGIENDVQDQTKSLVKRANTALGN